MTEIIINKNIEHITKDFNKEDFIYSLFHKEKYEPILTFIKEDFIKIKLNIDIDNVIEIPNELKLIINQFINKETSFIFLDYSIEKNKIIISAYTNNQEFYNFKYYFVINLSELNELNTKISLSSYYKNIDLDDKILDMFLKMFIDFLINILTPVLYKKFFKYVKKYYNIT